MPLEQMQQELLKQMGHQGNKIHPVPQVQSEAFVNQSTKRPGMSIISINVPLSSQIS